MRKCAQCGKDIPDGNITCNYCGYNPDVVSKNNTYSFGKSVNLNTNNPDKNFKIGKTLGSIFLVIFFGPLILGIFFIAVMIFFYNFDVFEEDYSCESFCAGEYTIVGDSCFCGDVIIYDEYENVENNMNDNINDNVHIYENNSINLESYVNNNEDVVVIVCSDFSSTCSQYATRMIDIAQRENFNLFVYKYELLNDDSKDSVLKYYLGVYDEFKPLTFIISNGKMKSYHEEDKIKSEIEEYLMNNGIM